MSTHEQFKGSIALGQWVTKERKKEVKRPAPWPPEPKEKK